MKQKLVIIGSVLTLVLFVVPDAGAQWVPVGLPGLFNNDEIASLAVIGTNLFAATGNENGVWRSTDSGANWILTDSGFTNGTTPENAGCFAVIGTNLFAGSGGVWLSTDSGTSWTRTTTGIDTNYNVTALLVSDTNIFAGYEAFGVSLSTNNGKSWMRVNYGLTDTGISALAVSGQSVFAGTGSGVFLSTNNGASWTAVNNGLSDSSHILSLATIGTNIFAATRYDGVFLSTNNGSSWTQANAGIPVGTEVCSFAVSGMTLLAGSSDGFYFTSDYGASWIGDSVGLSNAFFFAIAVSGTNIFGGISGGADFKANICKLSFTSLSSNVSPAISTVNSLASYPNPLTQSTTISFSSPESGAAEVTIVNILGSDVKRIFSGELSAGEHEFSWDASGMAQEIYECVVRMNGNAQQIPLAVVR